MVYDYETELYHYGVKGMRWGHHKQPDYVSRSPNDVAMERISINKKALHAGADFVERFKKTNSYKQDVVLKKGTTFQRIAGSGNADYTNGVYTSYKNADKDLYKGVLGRMRVSYMMQNEGQVTLKELTLTANKDIKLPSMETRLNEFKKLYKEDPEGVRALISEHEKSRYNRDYQTALNPDSKRNTKSAYEKFNDALSLGVDSTHGNVIKKYYDTLSKMGYDAIPDENDIRLGTFKAQAPIIMFDTKNSIGKTKTRNITASEVFAAYNRAMPKKMARNILKYSGKEKLSANSDKDIRKYSRQSKSDRYALSSKYTLNDLGLDWGKNRLTSNQIRRVSDYMDAGMTHDQAVSYVIAKGNDVLDKVLSKLKL